jgi:hypothetical protein
LNDEAVPAVLCPALFSVFLTYEKSTFGAECHVVIVSPPLIAVSFDLHCHRWVVPELICIGFERRASVGTEIITVELKVDFL